MNEFGKFISLAKVFAVAVGDRTVTVTSAERDAACEALKIMASSCNGWTEEQKEYYKVIVDSLNEVTK